MPLGRALFLMVVLGIVAYCVMALNVPKPFNIFIWGILLLIAVVILFSMAGVNTGFSF